MVKMLCDFCMETREVPKEMSEIGPVFCTHCGIKMEVLAPLEMSKLGVIFKTHLQGSESHENAQ